MRTPRRRTGVLAAVTALTVPLALSVPAAQAAVTGPPTGSHSIAVFTQSDSVAVEGWTESNLTVQVRRHGFVVGRASNLQPVNGVVEINHGGPPCWEGVTPDLRPGDVVEVLTAPDVGESTLTYDIRVTEGATETGPGTVTVKGTAGSVASRIPIDSLDARLNGNNDDPFELNARDDLRAPGDGTLEYDGPGTNVWTATFTGLTSADVARALTSEIQLTRFGGALPNEQTIFEHGVVGGAATDCTAPAATGPSVPDLTAASDSGASTSDNVTRLTSVTFGGAVGLADSTVVELFVDGVSHGTVTPSGGTYSFTTTLTEGRHQVTASESGPSSGAVMSAASLAVTVDTTAPVTPRVTATDPASGSPSRTPRVQGLAGADPADNTENTSRVSIHDNAVCSGTPLGSGTGQAFGATGITATVPEGSTTVFHAQTVDLAGNVSGCSTTSQQYVQDSLAPLTPTLGPGSTGGLVDSSDARFVFSHDEQDVSFTCSLDDGATEPCQSPHSYTGLGEGGHTFRVTATDPAGHTSDPLVVAWTVDTVAPAAPTGSPDNPSGVVSSRQASFSFDHEEPDVELLCALDDAAPESCLSPMAYTRLSQGPHVLSVVARDAVGHLSDAAVAGWTVDTRSPKVTARNPGRKAKNVKVGKTLKVTLSEKVSGATTRNVKVYAAGKDKAVKAVVRYNARRNILKIDPRSALQSGTRYSIELGRGIMDLAGNRLNPTRWRFTTRS